MRKHLATIVAAGTAVLIGGTIWVGSAVAGGDDDRSDDRRDTYQQTNLLSNVPGRAVVQDPHVVNSWGFAWAPGHPLWVANNGDSSSTVYTLRGDKFSPAKPVVVKLPEGADWPVTGMVWNPNDDEFRGAMFIWVDEQGRIATWSKVDRATATVVKTVPGAIYKGVTIATNEEGNFLFAANFHAGTVDVFNDKFDQVHKFAFIDKDLPMGYAPFNIVPMDGALFVSYAKQDEEKEDDVAGVGLGFVDVFTTSGKLVRRFASRGKLNAPWGMTRAPANFGKFSDDILVGNFGDGLINVFDNRGNHLGELHGRHGQPIQIDGLWSLAIGTFKGANPNELYFTAGPDDESNGVVGEIELVSGRH
jgi:uncharacterized protein (TIGR03118 family)